MQYNILCLHGCCQDKSIFMRILANFIKICKNDNINFYFIQAKYVHPAKGYTWYNKPLILDQIGKMHYDAELVTDCLDDIDKNIEENKINVLLGFSQGGNVVDTYLHYKNHEKIKKAIIISSYSFIDEKRKLIDDVEVLNILSENDDIVNPSFYPKDYLHNTIITHNKGHKIPGTITMRKVREFILYEKI